MMVSDLNDHSDLSRDSGQVSLGKTSEFLRHRQRVGFIHLVAEVNDPFSLSLCEPEDEPLANRSGDEGIRLLHPFIVHDLRRIIRINGCDHQF